MKKYLALLLPIILCLLGGCTATGSKTTDISAIYIVTTLLSILMLASYFSLIRKKRNGLFYCLFQPSLSIQDTFGCQRQQHLPLHLWRTGCISRLGISAAFNADDYN